MQSEERGLMITARLRTPLNFMLYLFIAAQYVVLFLVMRQARQQHLLSIGALFLPILYLCPLAVGLGFKQHIKLLLRKGFLSARAAYICTDWITCMLCIVYGILLEFRVLG